MAHGALRGLKAINASAIQLSLPVITALGGIVILSEPITLRFFIAAAAILGGVTLVIINKEGVN